MKFYVKTGGRTILFDVEAHDTVLYLKQEVEEREGIPPDQQVFVHERFVMLDDKPLSAYGIFGGDTLGLLVRPGGGQGSPSRCYLPTPRTIIPGHDDAAEQIDSVEQIEAVLEDDGKTKRYWIIPVGNSLLVGMRGPKNSIFEGGLILIYVQRDDRLTRLRLLTPIHHPYVYNPIEPPESSCRIPWGAILKNPFAPSPEERLDLRSNLDAVYNLLASEEPWTISRDLIRAVPSLENWINAQGKLPFLPALPS